MRIGIIFACLLGFFTTSASAAEESTIQAKQAIFAGGCFWCMESEFKGTLGVLSVVSGYTGGTVANPSYEQVSSGKTGHAEAIEITYDPDQIGYKQLLSIYWSNIDPTDAGGQFADRGSQYRTEIFYFDEEQHKLAQESKLALHAKLNRDIATVISPATVFYPAEEYHQDYAHKNPVQYNAYTYASGREKRLEELNK